MLLLVISTLVKIAVVLGILLGIAPVLVWAERRQSAMMQDRVGPVRAGVPLPGWQALVVAGFGAMATFWLVNALASTFMETSGEAIAWSWIPVIGGFAQFSMSPSGSWPALLCALVQLGGVGLAVFGVVTKATVAEFIRGPMAKGAKGLAWAATVFAVLSVIGGVYFVLSGPVDPGSVMTSGTYFTMAWIAALIAIVHFPLSWVVENSVDARDQLTVFGLIHPAVDAAKMIFKEDFVPPHADKFLYAAAPILATVPAFATFAVIPFGPDLFWGPPGDAFKWLLSTVPEGAALGAGTRVIPLQVVNINVGILYIFAIAGTGVVGAAIAGYSSDNKYALLGGLRAASQMVSYEVTLGLTLVGSFMVYNTLLLDKMVEWQQQHVWGFVVQPLGLVLFFFASIAEMKRVPFDAPEGESEIVAGYFLEYSGMKWGLYMTGEFIEHVVSSALIVTLFFGGYAVPFLHSDGFHFGGVLGYDILLPHIVVVLLGVLALLVKMAVVMFLQLQVRWTLPRFRYDQIMQLCWKLILPLSLANILVTGIFILMLP